MTSRRIHQPQQAGSWPIFPALQVKLGSYLARLEWPAQAHASFVGEERGVDVLREPSCFTFQEGQARMNNSLGRLMLVVLCHSKWQLVNFPGQARSMIIQDSVIWGLYCSSCSTKSGASFLKTQQTAKSIHAMSAWLLCGRTPMLKTL